MMRNLFGVTLIECLLAMTMSLLLLMVLNSLLLTLDNNREQAAHLHQIQENARMSHYFLQQAIEKTGITGCGKLTLDFPFINHTAIAWNKENSIEKVTIPESKPKTHAILLRYVDTHYALLLENTKINNILMLSAMPAFSQDDLLFITDCQKAELFTVQEVVNLSTGQRITTSPALTASYAKNAWVSRFEYKIFYIGKNNALMSRDNHNHHVTLVDDIDDVKIEQP